MLLMRGSSEPPGRCEQNVGAASMHIVIKRLGCRPAHRAMLDNNETGDMGMNDIFISVLSSQAEKARDRTHLTRFHSLTIRATMPRETD